jgi:hypothetical protein
MTTNLEQRKIYWETVYKQLRNWQILAGPLDTREEAQEMETKLAAKHSCESDPGGDDPDNPSDKWYVYGFNHDGKK